ncbi:hypothetical protein DVH05_010586 [Phytophthora capsici]|nr:hypothetical protein DVH05_010586 [Phytophthora capsici]
MAAPTGQAPRQTLTEDVRRRCLEGMLSDRHKRRIRRADGKTSAGASYQKKGSRKKPAKRTTPAMEVAQSKGLSEDHRPGGRPPERVEDAEAKGRACGEASDAMETAPAAPPEDRVDHAAVAAVVEAIVDCVAVAEATTPVRSPANDEKASRPSKTRLPPLSEAASRKRRRANLPDGSDGDSDSEATAIQEDARDEAAAFAIRGCVVDADPNIMDGGADKCTGLNSDEGDDVHEEPEEEEDAQDEPWDGDWDLGDLSDEENEIVHEELPPLHRFMGVSCDALKAATAVVSPKKVRYLFNKARQ